VLATSYALHVAREDGLEVAVRDFESELIEDALLEAGGSRAKAAQLLHTRRTTLVMKMLRYGLRGKKG
jgi:DNA-binding NtrC family response regulator